MTNQKLLKDIKHSVSEKLHHFTSFNLLYNSVERHSKRVNTKDFLTILDDIDSAIEYLSNHVSTFFLNQEITKLHSF